MDTRPHEQEPDEVASGHQGEGTDAASQETDHASVSLHSDQALADTASGQIEEAREVAPETANDSKTAVGDGGAEGESTSDNLAEKTEKAERKEKKKSKLDEDDPLSILDGKVVLITEDNIQIQKLITQRLKFHGATVEIAPNGRIAWDKLNQEPPFRPNVVLLDMMMPEMNGVELLGLIRKSEALRHLPVIVVSARRDRKLVILLMKMGIQGYVVKPLNMGETLMRISEVLRELEAPAS